MGIWFIMLLLLFMRKFGYAVTCKEKIMRKRIYVILTQTGTVPARIIKFITKAPYNHTSITSDEGLYEIYSFCRKFKMSPLPAGFVNETEVGVFEMFKNVPCEVYGFDVTEEQFNKYQELIEHFKSKSKAYSYNVLGLLALAFGIQIHRKNHFICSQWVAKILTECKIAKFDKDLLLVRPDDFRYLKEAKLIYKGDLRRLDEIKMELSHSLA